MGGRRRGEQQAFEFRTWGGRRPGAGRKRAAANVGLPAHVARPEHAPRVPVHVTLRAMRSVPALRRPVLARVVVEEIGRASAKGFRVLHFSVQNDHVHLIAEGDGGQELSRGMQRLASRNARRVNALAARRGTFWRERYHRRDLGTPRQFRNALVYVTFSARKHAPPGERASWANALDRWSSAVWVDDWRAANARE